MATSKGWGPNQKVIPLDKADEIARWKQKITKEQWQVKHVTA